MFSFIADRTRPARDPIRGGRLRGARAVGRAGRICT